jgi:stearoyl-CoA desaturase (Delta-9 desaturase)
MADAACDERRESPPPPSRFQKTLLATIVVVPMVALAYAMYLMWNRAIGLVDLSLFLAFYVLTTLGIGIGFHRMLTHKGFDAPAPVRFLFLALGSMAMEGPAFDWAATHTKHHAKSDREGDPHSPLDGFWHAHLGWLFRRGLKVEEIYYRGFAGDRVAEAVSKTFWLWAILSFALPFGIGFVFGGWFGAWTGLVWGGPVRIFFNQHVTWSVNSVCHTFGKKDFRTPDRSRNEWVVGLLALGEGWHNNHHAFPRSAVHGLRWYQFDLSGLVIRFLALIHLARNVFVVPKDQWKALLEERQAARRAGMAP